MKAPRGSLTTRLSRLEDRAAARAAARPKHPDEDGWLEAFERLGREGHFDCEPDFPKALASYRDALARAHASADPPFDPPPEFMPEQRLPHVRLRLWRTKEKFPEVWAGLEWLSEMLSRVCDGVPPVSEGEFAELVAWFGAHEAGLAALAGPAELLEAGVHLTWCASVRTSLAKGPRAEGSGRAAEDLRQLKARYGSRLPTAGGG